MEKILIELFVPAAGCTFDVFVPTHCKVSEVLQLLCAAVKELSEGKLIPQKDTLLCDMQGTPLDINMSVANANLRNSDRLMLI